MSALKNLVLAAALTALAAPAWAELTYTATGSYKLGSSSGLGGTALSPTTCGNNAGQDVLGSDGAGVNNIFIHAYACDDSVSSFGSRSSGENTFYALGTATIAGSIDVAEDSGFSFFISAGEVGAFGSTAFGAGEFQKSKLTIKLEIDGVTYLDEAWSAEILAGGASGTSSYSSNGPETVGFTTDIGAGFFSYGILGGSFFIPLSEGSHDISYVMTSEASGNILTTSACTAFLQSPRNQEGFAAAEVPEGPGTGEPFAAYCGAGARSGDPFGDPIARALPPGELPEPMSAGLALTALLAAAGARRRAKR